MASPAEHAKWAKHNEDFARWLDGKWPQWATVALFYAALHYVEAFLRADHGWSPKREDERHSFRNDYLRRNFPELARPYMRLFQWGHDARYNCSSPNRVDRAFEALEQVKAEIEHLRAAATNGV